MLFSDWQATTQALHPTHLFKINGHAPGVAFVFKTGIKRKSVWSFFRILGKMRIGAKFFQRRYLDQIAYEMPLSLSSSDSWP